jgi:hypothetical protein
MISKSPVFFEHSIFNKYYQLFFSMANKCPEYGDTVLVLPEILSSQAGFF